MQTGTITRASDMLASFMKATGAASRAVVPAAAENATRVAASISEPAATSLATADAARAAELLRMHSSELTPADWRTLSATLATTSTIDGVRLTSPQFGTPTLKAMAADISAGRATADAAVQRHFDDWAVDRLSPDERRAATVDLIGHHASELSSRDWTRLRSLLVKDSIGIEGSYTPYGDGATLLSIAGEMASGRGRVNARIQQPFTLWARRNERTYAAALQRSADAAAGGTATRSDQLAVVAGWDRLRKDLPARPQTEQTRLAGAVLGVAQYATPIALRDALGVLRKTAAETQLPAAAAEMLEPLRSETIDLIDANLARMQAVTAAELTTSVEKLPDYAELGSIRANISLLESAARTVEPVSSAHVPADVIVW